MQTAGPLLRGWRRATALWFCLFLPILGGRARSLPPSNGPAPGGGRRGPSGNAAGAPHSAVGSCPAGGAFNY